MKKHIDWATVLLNIFATLSFALIAWAVISFIAIIPTKPNPDYQSWNLWYLLLKSAL